MRLDYLGNRADNLKLINTIKQWWAKRGFIVQAWTEKAVDPTTNSTIWVVRTSIKQDARNIRKNYTVA
jgi:hypothetical protein